MYDASTASEEYHDCFQWPLTQQKGTTKAQTKGDRQTDILEAASNWPREDAVDWQRYFSLKGWR
jgi:hypothetical protein